MLSMRELAGWVVGDSEPSCHQASDIARHTEVFRSPWDGALALMTGLFIVALAVGTVAFVDSVVGRLVDDRGWAPFDKALMSFAAIALALPLTGASWVAIGLIPSTPGRTTLALLAVIGIVLLNFWSRRRRSGVTPSNNDTVH